MGVLFLGGFFFRGELIIGILRCHTRDKRAFTLWLPPVLNSHTRCLFFTEKPKPERRSKQHNILSNHKVPGTIIVFDNDFILPILGLLVCLDYSLRVHSFGALHAIPIPV